MNPVGSAPAATPVASRATASAAATSRVTATVPAVATARADATGPGVHGTAPATPMAPARSPTTGSTVSVVPFDGDWPGLAARLAVTGFVRQFMEQSELLEVDGLRLRVRVPIRPLAEVATVGRVRDALSAHFGAPVRLDVEVGNVKGTTAAGVSARERADRQAQAQAAIEADPFVRTLIDEFDGSIVPGSVRPLGRRETTGENDA